MNLNPYDVIKPNNYIIDVTKKMLYLKKIEYKKYYSFLCRYDKDEDDYVYYILLSNVKINKDYIRLYNTCKKRKNEIAVFIGYIIDKLPIDINKHYVSINLALEENEDDAVLYKLIFD